MLYGIESPAMTDLARWLERTGTTQAEFAAKIGAHQTQVSRYATGARSPSRRLRSVIEIATGGAVRLRSWREHGGETPRVRRVTSGVR